MVSNQTLLIAVLWKNWLLIRKQWKWVALEILVPILFFVLLCFARTHYSNVEQNSINASSPLMDMKTIKSFLKPDGSWNLWYAPSENHHIEIIDYVAKELGLDEERGPLNFESTEKLFEELHENYNGKKDIYAITFGQDINNQLIYNISIRKRYLEWNTPELFRTKRESSSVNSYNPYLHQGFLALQILINEAFIDRVFDYSHTPNITVTLEEIPENDRNHDNNLNRFFLTVFPMTIILSLCLPILVSVQKQMTRDQHSGMNDLMLVSGVKMWMILLGWFLHRTAMIVLSLVPIVILLKAPFWGTPHSPIQYCHWTILFLFMWLYCMTAVTTYLFIARVSKNSSVVYVICVRLWILSYFLFVPAISMEYTGQSFQDFTIPVALLSIVFPNIALHFGCKILTIHEATEIELNFSNLYSTILPDENGLQMGYILLILFLNIILTCIFTVMAFDFRNIKKPTFRSRNEKTEEDIPLSERDSIMSITNLTKRHGLYTTLDIQTLELYKGEITVVLGTNGSGKSTLISIITGITKPSSGSIHVGNIDGKKPLIGLCPQINVFFEELTVEENLQFFAKLRSPNVADSVADILNDLDLLEKKNCIARDLSTGLRRNLCFAMALVGDPQIMIFDEPSGGVINATPESFKEILKKRSTNNTIFITTGNSLVAEGLCDKILFMNKGTFLNQEISSRRVLLENGGYYISVMVSDIRNIDYVETQIKAEMPDLNILQRVGKRITLHFTDKKKRQEYIEKLEAKRTEWFITSISYNIWHMCNIFMKCLKEHEQKITSGTTAPLKKIKKNIDPKLIAAFERPDHAFQTSVLNKKWYFLKKKIYWFLPGWLTMFLFATLAIIWSSEGRYYYSYTEPSINLNLNVYENNQVFFSGINRSQVATIMQRYTKQIDNASVHLVDHAVTAIEERIKSQSILLQHTNIAAVEFNVNADESNLRVNIIYSPKAFHSAPIAVDLAMSAILGMTQFNESYTIETQNVPGREHHRDYVSKELSNDNIFMLWAILIPLGMLFLLADYVIFPNIEFSTQFLRLQATSLEKLIWYWNLQTICDSCLGFLQIGTIFLYILLCNNVFLRDPLLGSQEFLILFAIVCIYFVSQMPASYVFGSLKKVDNCYTKYFVLLGIVSGTLPFLTYIMFFENGIANFSAYILSGLFPQFAIGYNLYNFGRKFTENYNWDHMNPLVKNLLCRKPWENPCCLADSAECFEHRSYFDNETFGTKYNFFMPIITFIIWQACLIYVSTFRSWKLKNYKNTKPNNVPCMVHETSESNTGAKLIGRSLVIEKLRIPVLNHDINCTFEPNNIYGVIGPNGSGKSALLATITKENLSYKGSIYCKDPNERQIKITDENYIREIGYFPGRDNVSYWLTGRELLTLAGLTRGYNLTKSTEAVNILLDIFDLQQIANRKCSEYSCGQRKILQICNAFMGLSNFIVIDDIGQNVDIPTTKIVWDFMLTFKELTKKTVILGIARRGRYKTLCDGFLHMDGESETASSNFNIEFRMKIIEDTDELVEWKTKTQKRFKEAQVSCSPVQIVVKFNSNIEVKLNDLVERAESFKSDHPDDVEDYYIDQS